MFDQRWPNKSQFKMYTEEKVPKTAKTLEKQRIEKASQ